MLSQDKKISVVSHLEELRSRLIIVIIVLVIFTCVGLASSGWIINRLNTDLLPLGLGAHLIVTHPLEFLLIRLRVGVLFGFILAFPVIVYETIMFLAPALNNREKKLVLLTLPISAALFLIGVAFAYLILLKAGVWFLARAALTADILNMWSVSNFISFIFTSCILLGVVFQLPLIVLVLSRLGIIRTGTLRAKRKEVVVGVFVLSAIITPPDPVTQALVALPLILLYEASILIARVFS